jgi:hypothetical protein
MYLGYSVHSFPGESQAPYFSCRNMAPVNSPVRCMEYALFILLAQASYSPWG